MDDEFENIQQTPTRKSLSLSSIHSVSDMIPTEFVTQPEADRPAKRTPISLTCRFKRRNILRQ
jgi:hypothetical protein